MSQPEQEQPANLLALIKPVIVVILIAMIISFLTLNYYGFFQDEIPEIAPVDENETDPVGGIVQGALGNMIFYITFAALGGFILLYMLKMMQQQKIYLQR